MDKIYDKIIIIVLSCAMIILGIYVSTYKDKINTYENEIKLYKNMQQNLMDYNKQLINSNNKLVEEIELLKKYKLDPQYEMDSMIINYCEKYDIDWKIAISIARLETGNYTSKACEQYNNIGGMMYYDYDNSDYSLMQFDSKVEGVDKFVKNLKLNYFDKGLNTIHKIQPKYCPGSNNWVDVALLIYNNL